MNIPRAKQFVYGIVFISFVALLLYNVLAYRDLIETYRHSKEENAYVQLMKHLDVLNTSITYIERNEKPYLIAGDITKSKEIEDGFAVAKRELKDLEAERWNNFFKQADILFLDSVITVKAEFSKKVVGLSLAGKPGLALQLLNTSKDSLLIAAFVGKYNLIYDQAKSKLLGFQDAHLQETKGNFKLISIFSVLLFVFVNAILWLLWKQIYFREQVIVKNQIFSDIINNSTDSITIWDKDMFIISCNPATEKVFKYKPGEMLHNKCDDIFKSRMLKEELENKLATIKKEGHWEGINPFTDAEGNYLDLYTTINAIKNKEGIITGYFAIHANITDIRKAQEEVAAMAAVLKENNSSLELKLKEQTTLIREVLERVRDGFIATNTEFMVTYLNSTIKSLLEIQGVFYRDQYLFTILQSLTGEDKESVIRDCFVKQQNKDFEFLHSLTQKWFQVSIFPSDNGLTLYLKDITLNKKTADEIQKSRRLYQFISNINDLALHAANEEEIYKKVCGIAVETGGFLFAWIGQRNTVTQTIMPIYSAGKEEGYLELIRKRMSANDIPEGSGPTGKAMREKTYYYCNDIEYDPNMAIWRGEALRRGYRSSIALPFIVNNEATYVITIYANRPDFFTEEEVQLLSRCAGNISHALETFYLANKAKEAEKHLQKISTAINQSSASVVITDIEGRIEYVNPAFTKTTGYSFEEAIGQNPKILKSGYTSDKEYINLWDNLTHYQEWKGEFRNRKKNGEYYWEYAVISPVVNENGIIQNYVAVKENITERKKLQEEQKQLYTIMENTTAYIGIADLNRNLIYMNKAFRDDLEIGEDENITALNIADFVGDAKMNNDTIMSVLFDTGKWMGENIFKSRSGKKIPVIQVIVLHKNEKGEHTHTSTTAINISQNKQDANKLQLLNKELRQLSSHLQHVSEVEKKEIAREIHDELGQGLTIMKFDVSWLKKHIDADKATIESKLDNLLESIADVMTSFRKIYTSLHPAMLEEIGLNATLEWLTHIYTKSTNIPVSYTSYSENIPLSMDKSLAIYRIVQECLTNILRYANATAISIRFTLKKNNIVLEIEDNGKGFEVAKVDTKQHHGILGMRERMYAFKGTFSISSVIGKGTQIKVELPV